MTSRFISTACDLNKIIRTGGNFILAFLIFPSFLLAKDPPNTTFSLSTQRALAGMEEKLSDMAEELLRAGPWKYSRRPRFHYFYRDVRYLRAVSGRADRLFHMLGETINENRRSDRLERIVVFLVDEGTWLSRWPGLRGFKKNDANEIYVNMSEGKESVNTFIHELSHAVVDLYAGARPVPRWLDEGFAMYTSKVRHGTGERYELPGYLREEIRARRYIPLRDLLALTGYPDKGNGVYIFYFEAERTFRLMTRTFGNSSVGKILEAFILHHDLPSDKRFEWLVSQTKSSRIKTLDEFEKYWEREIKR